MKRLLSLLILVSSLNSFGQEIVAFSMSDCERGSYPQFTKNRLISKEFRSDTTYLTLGMVLNCGIKPVPVVELSGDSLFISFKDSSEGYTMCDCCFELNYTLTHLPDTNFTVYYGLKGTSISDEDGRLFYRKLGRHSNKFHFPSYDELMEAVSTENPNQVNEDGEKIGIWIQLDSEDENSPFRVFSYELDENNQSYLNWLARFSVDQYLILDEIVIRTSKNDISSIPGRMYYDIQGVHIIKD